MSRAEALAAGRGYLRNSQVEATNEDARLLLLDACGVDPVALVTDGGRPLTEPEADRFATSLDRRAAGEPTSRMAVSALAGAASARVIRMRAARLGRVTGDSQR